MFPTRALLGRSVWKVLQLPPKSETIGDGVDRIRDTNFIDTVFLSRAHCHLPRIHPQSVLKSAPRRSSPIFVGLRFAVHNGKTYQEIQITEEMVGRKLGEYVATRKRFTYKQSKNK
ncbi:hypothetical protein N7450_000741 [Penicillium hetheringtonii]|uniref:Ribosomal protein S19 n=1 Tax=Penicillium hetheringtonii TaxID=911720 RepID=A0AAD6E2T3_9EURO|nr:hypothetical protein N7450_000741 [Penicillium hetheringtonii]